MKKIVVILLLTVLFAGYANTRSYLINENFDAATTPQLPPEWLALDGNGNNLSRVTMAYGQSAPNSLTISGDEMAMNDWVFTPGFSTVPNTTYTLKFSYRAYSDDYPERFEIKYGTAQNVAAMSSVISQPIEVTSESYITDSVTFTTTTNEIINIGFHGMSDEMSSFLSLDDIQVTGIISDPLPPSVTVPTGRSAATGYAMNISTTVSDQSGIGSVVGHYKLNGQSNWNDFSMSATKATGVYSGTIPAQQTAITGKIKFTCTDTVSPNANTGDSPEFNIAWLDEPQGLWTGSVNAQNTGGLGLNNGIDWSLGLIVDLGLVPKKISKIDYMCNTGTNGPLNWRVFAINDSVNWTETELVASRELIALPEIGTSWNEVAVNDTTKLSGLVGLVVDLPNGGFFGRHAEGIESRSYVLNYTGEWIKLGTANTAFEEYAGDWTLKCFVERYSGVGINESTEILPGRSELRQNYPNPFNPTTTISFYNNMTGNVKLTVLNAKGETVTTLINNEVAAGNHKVNFNAERYNSGVYFYKLETPTATITKKMLLIK